MQNSIFRKSSYSQIKLKKKIVELEFLERNSSSWNSSSTLKLDFDKIEFQNRGISLNSFRQKAFCWNFLAKEVFFHFGPGCVCLWSIWFAVILCYTVILHYCNLTLIKSQYKNTTLHCFRR